MSIRSLLFATVATTLLAVGPAAAGSFALKERSATAQGASFAGATSAASDISFAGFNPAALRATAPSTESRDGISIAGSASVVGVSSEGTVSTGGTVDPGKIGVVPAGYLGWRIDEDLVFGVGSFSQFGLSTEYATSWTGAGDGIQSTLQSAAVSPMFSYDVTDWVTVGAALNILYVDARLTSATQRLDGNTLEFGFMAGALFDVADRTTLGIAYQSGYNLGINGNVNGLPAVAGAELPMVVSAGVTHGFTDDFRVMAEVQWQNWSAFDKIDVTVASAIFQSDPQNYDDAFFVALGAEYDITPEFTLRGGAAWDQTPTNDDILPGTPPALGITNRTVRVPDTDRVWLSLGASYDLTEHMAVDVAYSFLFGLEDARVGLRSVPGTSVEYDAMAHIFTVGGRIDF